MSLTDELGIGYYEVWVVNVEGDSVRLSQDITFDEAMIRVKRMAKNHPTSKPSIRKVDVMEIYRHPSDIIEE
jgi:hypothetical protein